MCENLKVPIKYQGESKRRHQPKLLRPKCPELFLGKNQVRILNIYIYT